MAYVKGQPFRPQFLDSSGSLMSGGTIEFYRSGISAPTPYYTDAIGTSGGTSLTLNASGYPPNDIFYDTSIAYKIVVKDAGGTTIHTIEPWQPAGTNSTSVIAYGATGDGTTDDRAAIDTADTAAVAAGSVLLFTPGTYKIDVTSTGLVLNSPCEFLPGAKLVIYRTSGTNKVDIRGSVKHYDTQFIDITNVASTKAAWDTIWSSGTSQSDLPITFGFGASTYNQFDRVPIDYLCPQNFGAVGITGTDDTLAVQVCFDMHQPVRLVTNHDVTQVTLRGNELFVNFSNYKLLGVPATTDYSSVLEIKCGYSKLKNIRVDSQKSQYYQVGIHWYTNDINTFYPGHNQIEGIYIEQCYLPLCIGGLPGQTEFEAQGTAVTAPEATDAPLSESYITGLDTINSLGGVMVNQPNGKIRTLASTISTPSTAGYSNPSAGRDTLNLSEYSTIDVRHVGSEIVFESSFISNQDTSDTIPLWTIKGGTLIFSGCDWEAATHCRVKACTGTYAANGSTNAGSTYYGDSYVIITNCTNFGWNGGSDEPVIVVEDKANGCLMIDQCRPAFSVAQFNNRTAPFVMVTDTFTGLDAGATVSEIIAASTELVNPYIQVRFSDLNFRDLNPRSLSSSIVGITRGLPNLDMRGLSFVRMTDLDIVDPSDDPATPSALEQYVQAGGSRNLLAGLVDPTGKTIGSAVTSGTDGGWTVSTTGSSQVDGVSTTTGPIVVGDDITDSTPDRYDYAIRLSSGTGGGGNTCSIASPEFSVEPNRSYIISYFVRTNTGTPGAYNHIARLKSYDFDGNNLSDDDPITVREDYLESEWQHITVVAKTNKNASEATLFLYCENGASVDITNVQVF